ncbi:uncharacterized protein [Euwallacea fornicatus]|uniref:uncharacterized protein n=1 Tax=Euwallacea fornicatus TaxID=995702 RepID=UPI0033902B3F
MRSKEEIPNKTDYMKAYTFNLIQTERTNCELENEENVGRIDETFYRNFSWQIMGKRKERKLSQSKTGDVPKIKNRELSAMNPDTTNGRLQDASKNHEEEVDKIVLRSRTDFTGNFPKRYFSTCYLKPKVVPVWYTESLILNIGSTKRFYTEKIWFKNVHQPYYWSEKMTTEVNFPPTKTHISQLDIPVPAVDGHYISLEPQQIAAGV